MIERRETPHSRSNPTPGPIGRSMVSPTHRPASLSVASLGSEGLLTVLWRNRWIVLVCTLATLAAGFGYVSVATPVYTSTAKLYLNYESIQISQYEPGQMPRTDKYLHTQAEVLRSRDILAAALGTENDPPLRTLADVEVPLAYLRKATTIDVGRKDEIISISFDSRYPVEAAQIVNRIVEAYMISRSEDEQRDATKALRILEAQFTLCKDELNAKRAELCEFQVKSMPASLGMDDGAGARQGYLECQSGYRQAQEDAARAKMYLDGVQALAENPAALRQYVQTDSRIMRYESLTPTQLALESRLTELDLKRVDLLKNLTEGHQAVAAVDVEKQRLEAKVTALDDEFVGVTIMAAQRRYEEAQANEQECAKRYEQESENVRQVSTELQMYEQLRAEVDRLEASAATFEREVAEIRKMVGEDIGRMKMAMLEPALPSDKPSAPQKGRIMALTLIVGLALGGGIAVVRDWANQSFHSAEEISAILDLPALGVVPAMSRRQTVPSRGQKVALQPHSPEAEAYRTVRTGVFFGTPAEAMRTLLVTSPAAGDGKSTLVSNLAITMAQAGQNTLVLDADLRKPTQHAIFAMDHHDRCLKNVFAGRMKLAEAIQPTRVKGLSVLTCGYDVPNPAELLNSRSFAKLLERLAKTYDRVLVDAPPVMVVTDAQILGALCDYTILVVRAGKSSRRTARRAVDALRSVGANVLGVVVNAVNNGENRYGYYGGSRRYGQSHSHTGGNGQAKKGKGLAASRQEAVNPNVTRSS